MTGGKSSWFAGLAGVVLAGLGCLSLGFVESSWAQEKPAADPAVARARKQVQMLDDLYKTAIVLITEHYVKEDSDLAAGSAFQALFKAMKDKGYHEVRLLDATGEPYEEKNKPQDDFEKAAIKALKAGKANYEEIVTEDGAKYLRIATPIPVVMKKCTLCHDNYNAAKPGEAIGALGYKLKIE
ncbi:MAG: DUF3365 domain-containing protein [Pirellulaceae bacterium]|jgi:hypothetical protein|nr:DUF3365 domain-containing protein [Pirellulaceae bacterium]